MPVRHKEEAFVLLLQLNPVIQSAVQVAKVQTTCRAHSAQYSLAFHHYSELLSVSPVWHFII
jgi:hypothetical protein